MKKNLKTRFSYIVSLVILSVFMISCGDSYQKTATGIVYKVPAETNEMSKYIAVDVLSQDIVKISVAENDSLLRIKSLIAKEKLEDNATFTTTSSDENIRVITENLQVTVNKKDGSVNFYDETGKSLLKTADNELIAKHSHGISYYQTKQNFSWKDGEALYGLGQHEVSKVNLRGQKIELVQLNTRITVPVLLSTEGYGLYWDNYSQSYFNDSADAAYLASDVADKIQYYFVKGEKFDNIIGGIRTLTGKSPMLPRWSLGYIQSRNRYKTREQLMTVVKKHRQLNIPIDAIILDYMHWGESGFGSMVFDEGNFPNAQQMIDELHDDYNCRLITSVWPTFQEKTNNYKLFKKDDLLLGFSLAEFGEFYDAFNPKAGELYWQLVKKNYWDKGVDGIWCDATEPEEIKDLQQSYNHLGPSIKYQNLYSFYDMKNLYEPQIKIDTNRVFILTRSAFLGQQKYGTVMWSGDINTNFKALKEQIATGLNFCMTGIPFWNTDIGGYWGGNPKDKAYQELFVRWFQYGAFTPFFRAHGRRYPIASRNGHNEIWSFGADNQVILNDFINLRYRLLPYLYTLNYKVYNEDYTMMRALAFDFMDDKEVYDINDQFLVENLMICPVTEAKATERKVYLPKGCDWYDFWTGVKYQGGQSIISQAPIDKMPIFVKAGTILPLADVMQYSSEKTLDNIEVRIYPGKDADYTLYEDEGNNYNYEIGRFSKIKFAYSQNDNTLSIASREGSFNGMLKERKFNIVIVNEGIATGIEESATGINITYDGYAKRLECGTRR